MNLLIAVKPNKLAVTLKGELKNSMGFVEGLYILESDEINGKPYWIQDKAYWNKERGMAIWYEKEDGFESWNIGEIEDLGNSTVFLYSSSYTVGPHETSTWNYFVNDDDDTTFETTDVIISPSSGILHQKQYLLFLT